jgi:S-adenosylhomocysteine hydrolase
MGTKPVGGALRLSDIYDFLSTPPGLDVVQGLLTELKSRSQWSQISRTSTVRGTRVRGVILEQQQPRRNTDAFDQVLDQELDGLDASSPLMTRWHLPTAVSEAFRQATDKEGVVHGDRLSSDSGRRTFAAIQHGIQEAGDDFTPQLLKQDPFAFKYMLATPRTLHALAASVRLDDFGDRMPSLARVTQKYGGPTAFAQVHVAALQHLFQTSASLIGQLEANGPRSLSLLGKPYSTDPRMYAKFGIELQDIGSESFWASGRPEGATNSEWLKASAAERLTRLFQGVDPQGSERFVLLDEGGYLTRTLNSPEFEKFAHLCVVVEQTQSGGDVVEELAAEGKLHCDVIAVWKSWFKKDYESPAIGESIVHQASEQLAFLGLSLNDEPRTATLVGFGAVNSQVAAALVDKGYRPEDIFVVDPDPQALERARAHGFVTADKGRSLALQRAQMLPHGHNVFVATGKRALTPEDFTFLPNDARIINGGSGDVEASADLASFKQYGYAHDRRFGWNNYFGRYVRGGEFAPKSLLVADKEILVLRGGFVVNMERGLPPDFAQIPRSLMLAGALQAARLSEAQKPGDEGGHIVELDDGMQKDLHTWIAEDLRTKDQTLEHPNFERLAPY